MNERTTSPAFYEERIRLMEAQLAEWKANAGSLKAENQRLRDAVIALAHEFLDGTPSAAQTLEDVSTTGEKAAS